MDPMLIAVIAVVVFLAIFAIFVILAMHCSKSRRESFAASPHPGMIEDTTAPTSNKGSGSGERIDTSPSSQNAPPNRTFTPCKISGDRSLIKSKSSASMGERSGVDGGRLRMKDFKYAGTRKRFTRITDGPLIHSFSNIPRKHCPVQKILTKEIKGELMMYQPDFVVQLPMVAARGRKAEIIESYYHLGMPVMDQNEYRRKRFESLNIPELVPVEGNHAKVKNMVEGTPFLEIKPHLAKMPAKRDDTIRHFILNTQYASRLAVRFKCASGRYVSIPNQEILEPCGRLRVVIVANSDMEEQPEKEVVYYEYIQVPERAMDAQHEFMKRPVIGRISLRLFPNFLNLSPNTFYPSTRRKTTVYISTLTNSGKSPCKFSWPDERDVIVSPQNGFIKPLSAVQFTFTPKRISTLHAIVAEMKYALNDKPNAHGTLTVRFETANMKRLIQVSTKALAACDTAEDPGYCG